MIIGLAVFVSPILVYLDTNNAHDLLWLLVSWIPSMVLWLLVWILFKEFFEN